MAGAPTAQHAADYTVVGAGAIGGTLAYHLARAGKSVVLVDADSIHVDAINRRGLQVQSDFPQKAPVNVAAFTPGEFQADLRRVILAVKAQHTAAAMQWISPRLLPDGWVVSMQNGLNEDTISGFIGAERTIAAFVNLNADVVGPGVIHDGGTGALVVGELDGVDSPRTRELASDLSLWGQVVTSGNVQGYLWAKLAYGAMLTTTALSNTPMAESVTRYETAMTAVAREICAIADAKGIALESFDAFNAHAYGPGSSPDQASKATLGLATWLATLTKTHSGIWRDIAVRHRKSEVPTHYAPVLAMAVTMGIPTPCLSESLRMLSEIEAGERNLTDQNLNSLSALIRTKVA